MVARERTDVGSCRRGRRHARLAAFAMAAGMWLASAAAAAGDSYLRGGIGLDWPGDTAFTDVDCRELANCGMNGVSPR